MCQLTGMRNLAAPNRTYLPGGDCYDCRGLSGEGYELDLIRLMPRINVHHGSDIARLKALLVQRRGQHHSVVFANHVCNILKRKGRDQSWKNRNPHYYCQQSHRYHNGTPTRRHNEKLTGGALVATGMPTKANSRHPVQWTRWARPQMRS